MPSKGKKVKMRNSHQKSGWYPMKDVMLLQIFSGQKHFMVPKHLWNFHHFRGVVSRKALAMCFCGVFFGEICTVGGPKKRPVQ